ncbi:MAG: 50S ribosomal protein L4 [Ardenticatenaceae bacterium]|nr:50S ribosomal protein L4 [Ardenticatenaceae bacterium]
MQLSVVNMAGDVVNSIELPADIFEANVNVGLMHQALVRQLSNARLGTHKVKGRSEVSRTGAKLYRQKGTGNARHGSRRAPIFVGGGVAHGPQVRDYSKKMPRKMRRAALRSALTAKAAADGVIVVDEITMDQPKAKEMAALVKRLAGDDSTLVVIPGRDVNVERSARNLADVKAIHAPYLNMRDLLGHEKVVLSLDAFNIIVDILGTSPVMAEESEA